MSAAHDLAAVMRDGETEARKSAYNTLRDLMMTAQVTAARDHGAAKISALEADAIRELARTSKSLTATLEAMPEITGFSSRHMLEDR